MTNILITAATERELQTWGSSPNTDTLVTGVGMPETFLRLGNILRNSEYQMVINIGIAGAFPGSGLEIGDVVLARDELFGDVGIETPDAEAVFTPLADTEHGSFYREPLEAHVSDNFKFDGFGFSIQIGRGLTVNSCCGTENTGEARRAQFMADFETMEGAAVIQLASQFQLPVVEIRAISNMAARRDMQGENIKLALANLGLFLTCFKQEYDTQLFHSDFALPQ